MMAYDDLQNKTDGILDDILPDIDLRFIVRSPLLSFSLGSEGAKEMMDLDISHLKACIGPKGYLPLKGSSTFSLFLYD